MKKIYKLFANHKLYGHEVVGYFTNKKAAEKEREYMEDLIILAGTLDENDPLHV